ncbi:hypothetical protein CYY_008373 [Polysphondylium violaceum]|uniref:Right handed beta helix domain-containing protein n=1 Tax=Polysphondylium violaceum TaxID=133409 RepID=A0A8J4UWZ7_9MYCE|nr:hypothetical protein CYY_008373 [Polysphondylium violaceum]
MFYRKLLFVCLFLTSITYINCDGITLYVNSVASNKDPNCGESIDLACTSIQEALSSYSLSTKGENSTSLTLELLDGTYDVSTNAPLGDIYLEKLNVVSYSNSNKNLFLTGSKDEAPFFSYLQNSPIGQSLLIANITFINSYKIILSNSNVDVVISDCVFRDVSNQTYSSMISLFSNQNPSASISNSLFTNISLNVGTITKFGNYTLTIDNNKVLNVIANYIFFFDTSSVDIENLVINNGSTTFSPIGAGKSSFSLKDGSFSNNFGGSSGVLMFFLQDKPLNAVIQDSSFTDNLTPFTGGAIYFSTNNGLSVVNNCNFSSNLVYDKQGVGGAIYVNSPVAFNNCIFNNNTANNGGAMYINKSNATLTSSTLFDNKADQGGAIYTYASKVSVDSDSLANNIANQGGEVFCYGSSINITLANNNPPPSGYYCPFKDCTFNAPSSFKCTTPSPSSTSGSSGSVTPSNQTSSENAPPLPSPTPNSGSNDKNQSIPNSSTDAAKNDGSPTSPKGKDKDSDRTKIIIATICSIGGVCLVVAVIYVSVRYHRKRHHHSHHGEYNQHSPLMKHGHH